MVKDQSPTQNKKGAGGGQGETSVYRREEAGKRGCKNEKSRSHKNRWRKTAKKNQRKFSKGKKRFPEGERVSSLAEIHPSWEALYAAKGESSEQSASARKIYREAWMIFKGQNKGEGTIRDNNNRRRGEELCQNERQEQNIFQVLPRRGQRKIGKTKKTCRSG